MIITFYIYTSQNSLRNIMPKITDCCPPHTTGMQLKYQVTKECKKCCSNQGNQD